MQRRATAGGSEHLAHDLRVHDLAGGRGGQPSKERGQGSHAPRQVQPPLQYPALQRYYNYYYDYNNNNNNVSVCVHACVCVHVSIVCVRLYFVTAVA